MQPEVIRQAFLDRFGGAFEPCPAMNNFENAVRHTHQKMTINWGGINPHPNCVATSHHAHRIAEWMRSVFPRHKVSRADVALDFRFPEALDYLAEIIKPIAEKSGVGKSMVGDPDENDVQFPQDRRKGRTWYFGSHKSAQMVTVYEKGYELRAKGFPNVDPDLVRLEVRIRPQKARKEQAASLAPFELLGFSKWISTAVGEILEEAPTVLPDYDKMEKDALHSLRHMFQQYGGVIRAYLDGADIGGHERSVDELNAFMASIIYAQRRE